jgi:hypothetical protein
MHTGWQKCERKKRKFIIALKLGRCGGGTETEMKHMIKNFKKSLFVFGGAVLILTAAVLYINVAPIQSSAAEADSSSMIDLDQASASLPAEPDLESPFLADVPRQAFGDDLAAETKIGSYSGDVATLANDEAKALLAAFNIPYDVGGIRSADVIRNNFSGNVFNRVKTDHAEIDFDENGNLARFFNKDDFSTVDRDRRDYATNQSPSVPPPVIVYDSEDSLKSIIDNFVSVNQLVDYEFNGCDFDNHKIWMLAWYKKSGNGPFNPYDGVFAMIDATDGSISSFARSRFSQDNVEPNAVTPLVTKEGALSFAEQISARLGENTIISANNTDTELTFFRPNFFWEDGGPYKPAGLVRLAWKVTVDNDAIIYVDARTGEILGGDRYQWK